jgi:rhamnosyltransferase
MTPRVSIVIPTKNGAATLPALLDAIWRQRAPFGIEVIAIDSGSTDGTVDLLRRRVDRLIEIPAAAFNHGSTRNAGVEASQGEFAVMIVQDAEPVGDTWLVSLLAPLLADARVAGAFCRQRPRESASALTRYYLDRYLATSPDARTIRLESPAALEGLDPLVRLDRCTFDNVASCLRVSVWRDLPFPATPIAEDVAWARAALLAGYAIAYVPDAVVIHSHDRSARYEFQRTRSLHARLRALFGVHTIQTRVQLARAIVVSSLRHVRLEAAHPSAWPHAIALAFAAPLGQYLGARDAERGAAPGGILGV